MPTRVARHTRRRSLHTSGSHKVALQVPHLARQDGHPWATAFKGSPGEVFQGFYIYRNDRLLQVGGWSAAANAFGPAPACPSVVIDDASAIGSLLTMNPEKSGLRV